MCVSCLCHSDRKCSTRERSPFDSHRWRVYVRVWHLRPISSYHSHRTRTHYYFHCEHGRILRVVVFVYRIGEHVHVRGTLTHSRSMGVGQFRSAVLLSSGPVRRRCASNRSTYDLRQQAHVSRTQHSVFLFGMFFFLCTFIEPSWRTPGYVFLAADFCSTVQVVTPFHCVFPTSTGEPI